MNSRKQSQSTYPPLRQLFYNNRIQCITFKNLKFKSAFSNFHLDNFHLSKSNDSHYFLCFEEDSQSTHCLLTPDTFSEKQYPRTIHFHRSRFA